MVEAGILDGDFALIQRTEVAREGQIVVALIDESEATLKYFHKDGQKVQLIPANSAYEPQLYDARQVRIQGKLAGLLRRYN
jgi:repressor LexA